ncbi:hypothetical protein DM860_015192 [Cuscuta australis]|uniref:BHLH domain-containing protein n=1 Tax=Cuscuta australis TaxID=267555 RepID=A0A328D354_9ASTE|nr:hypothetical protein DM860_015192 [Cuscuta australis]
MGENGFQESLVWDFNPAEWASPGSGDVVAPPGLIDNAIKSESSPPPPSLLGEAVVGAAPSPGRKRPGSPPLPPAGDHEGHIWTERERRKRMRNMFSNLHALLPQLPPKVDKSTIVDEAVNQIQELHATLHHLQKLKQQRKSSFSPPQKYATITASSQRDHNHQMTTTREAFLAADYCLGGFPNNNNNIMVQQYLPAAPSNDNHAGVEAAAFYKTWTSPNVSLNVCGDDAHISVCCPAKPGLLTTICYVMDKYKIEVISAHVSSLLHLRSMFMIHARVTGGYATQFPVEEIYRQAAEEILLLCGIID